MKNTAHVTNSQVHKGTWYSGKRDIFTIESQFIFPVSTMARQRHLVAWTFQFVYNLLHNLKKKNIMGNQCEHFHKKHTIRKMKH